MLVVLGNSATATKLNKPRNITLNGAVSGNANFDGSGNVTITTTQANIAVVTSSLTTPDTTSSSTQGVVDIPYPAGFNKNNCVIISLMSKNNSMSSESNQKWSTIGLESSSSVVKGNLGLTASLNEANITVWISKAAQEEQSKNIGIKLVLMKIS